MREPMITSDFAGRRVRPLGALLAAMVSLLLLGIGPSPAFGAAEWDARADWGPSVVAPGAKGGLRLQIGNVGDTTAAGWPTIEIELPEGFTLDQYESAGGVWSCSAGTPQTVTCFSPFASFFSFLWPPPKTYLGGTVGGNYYLYMNFDVAADVPVGATALQITLSGAGAPVSTTLEERFRVGAGPVEFGIHEGSFKAEARDEAGNPYAQAGGHPFEAFASFQPAMRYLDPMNNPDGWTGMVQPVANVKDVIVDLPVGFAGDPLAVPRCTKSAVAEHECPPETQVGVVETNNIALPQIQMHAVYNVAPSRGAVAQFMFNIPFAGPVLLTPVLRSDGEWALSIQTREITEANPLYGFEIHLWGVPADASHDQQRCLEPSHMGQVCAGYHAGGGVVDPTYYQPHASTVPRRALITMPTECDGQPDVVTQHMASWLDFGDFTADDDPDLSDPSWKSYTASSAPIAGCEALEFEPTLKARPTTDAADSPTGLDVDLHIPQNMDPDGLATAHLRDVTTTLPEGLVINPSGANGLGACSEDQANLDTRLPDDCPEQAKIGRVSVETPVLDNPLPGAVYVAAPHDNPFDSLLAVYVTIDDHQTGIVGKIPGEVKAHPQTGRLTATYSTRCPA